MAQVSRRTLGKKVEERILDLFWTSFSKMSKKGDMILFLEDLLTSTEKVMLSKRLSIAFLLVKGYDYRSICNLLKVSSPTVWAVNLNLKHTGLGYKKAIENIINKESWNNFWQSVNDFMEDALPPRHGTDWKEVRRKQWENRKKNIKPF